MKIKLNNITNKKILSKADANRIVASRTLITQPGKYVVKVKDVAKTKDGKTIVNTNCCTLMQYETFMKLTSQSGANYQYEVNRCQLSFAKNEMKHIPAKTKNGYGYVTIVVAMVKTHKGQNQDLRIVGMMPADINNPLTLKEIISKEPVSPIKMLALDILEQGNINAGIDSNMPY